MQGWISLGSFAYGLLYGTRNVLKDAPLEYKFLVTNTLAAMWCVTFGIFTAELLFIGYNIIGHTLLISCVFFTWFVFASVKKETPNREQNLVQWDLEREG
ncbi:MAG: hypothetical protein L7U49_05500 [Litoricolaceae bacterium]|nr:hypothetical protein [Litorivicinaceae bacterium]